MAKRRLQHKDLPEHRHGHRTDSRRRDFRGDLIGNHNGDPYRESMAIIDVKRTPYSRLRSRYVAFTGFKPQRISMRRFLAARTS